MAKGFEIVPDPRPVEYCPGNGVLSGDFDHADLCGPRCAPVDGICDAPPEAYVRRAATIACVEAVNVRVRNG